AQRNAAVMVSAATQHARAIPHELTAGRGRIGFPRHLPAAYQCGVIVAEWFLFGAGSTMRSVVVPLEHVALLGGIVVGPGLQHTDLGSRQRQNVRRNPSTGSGPDYHYVIRFWTGFNLRHRPSRLLILLPLHRRADGAGGYYPALRLWNSSNVTAATITQPMITCCRNGEMPSRLQPLLSSAMISDPTIVP